MAEHEALWLLPCRGVHTLGLRADLDVLFLDAQGHILRGVFRLAPNRCAWHGAAYSVVELPGGYCRRHPGYAQALADALSREVNGNKTSGDKANGGSGGNGCSAGRM